MRITKSDSALENIEKKYICSGEPNNCTVALCGNPNVGKSTVFNALTGMNQHTGNWPGKTVEVAEGNFQYDGQKYRIIDLPGMYSLMSLSTEEEVASEYICFGSHDAVLIVCDATSLERNLCLAYQIIEATDHVAVCVNLMDEARKNGIKINIEALERELGVPTVGISAKKHEGFCELMYALKIAEENRTQPKRTSFDKETERAISTVSDVLKKDFAMTYGAEYIAQRIIEDDKKTIEKIEAKIGLAIGDSAALHDAISNAKDIIARTGRKLSSSVTEAYYRRADAAMKKIIRKENTFAEEKQLRIDKALTGRIIGIPIMILLLASVFYITLSGANYPSALLSDALFSLIDDASALLISWEIPTVIHDMLIFGVFRVLAWVVAVMLPPMAIFFPLFTLLEDLGYLPRVAFNLDRPFRKCNSCGKQALCMAMGFGCNAAGVIGCRIINSPRERLIAILTNSFVPCNGRFPTLMALITMFFAGAGVLGAITSASMMTLVIMIGVLFTFLASKLLSVTLLKGEKSSFILEMPPFRTPNIGKVLIRSMLDRTAFVLLRAVAIAAPAGLVIWLLANINAGGISLIQHIINFLDPFARVIGLDGVILAAFVLGIPANEIVLPIIIMCYLSTGQITEMSDLMSLYELLVSNGWTWLTAICTMLFSLFHWPCSTTIVTIYKETKSLKWTIIACVLPTAFGLLICFIVTSVVRLISMVC